MQQSLKQSASLRVGRPEGLLKLIAHGRQFINLGNDASLLGKRWDGDRNPVDLPDAEAVETRRSDGQPELFDSLAEWPTSNDVILMDAVSDLTIPERTAANLSRTAIAFNRQQVSRF
jgi:hypothetical protein